MIEITDQQIKDLAHVSRLHLEDKDLEYFRKDLSDMVHFLEKLKDVDTNGIAPFLDISGNVDILHDKAI